MEKNRKELRELLEQALSGLGEKEELIHRLTKLENKIDSLDKKIDKIVNGMAKEIVPPYRKHPPVTPPWQTTPQWPPYTASFINCGNTNSPCEYPPGPHNCILPPNCIRCGKSALSTIMGGMGTIAGDPNVIYTSWNSNVHFNDNGGACLDDGPPGPIKLDETRSFGMGILGPLKMDSHTIADATCDMSAFNASLPVNTTVIIKEFDEQMNSKRAFVPVTDKRWPAAKIADEKNPFRKF
jgi:hypothetical protein